MLLVSPGQRDDVIDGKTRVTVMLRDQYHRVVDQRSGTVGRGWVIAAPDETSPPGVELIVNNPDNPRDFILALAFGGKYTLVVSVVGTQTSAGRKLSPELWAGGCWPWD
jgi:hypothetical protein